MADTVINQPRGPNDFYKPPITDVLQIMTERQVLKKWLYGEYVQQNNGLHFVIGEIVAKLTYRNYFELAAQYGIKFSDANRFLLYIDLYVSSGDDETHFNEQDIERALLALLKRKGKSPPPNILQIIDHQLSISPETQKKLDESTADAPKVDDVFTKPAQIEPPPEYSLIHIGDAIDIFRKRFEQDDITIFDFAEITKLNILRGNVISLADFEKAMADFERRCFITLKTARKIIYKEFGRTAAKDLESLLQSFEVKVTEHGLILKPDFDDFFDDLVNNLPPFNQEDLAGKVVVLDVAIADFEEHYSGFIERYNVEPHKPPPIFEWTEPAPLITFEDNGKLYADALSLQNITDYLDNA